MSLGRQPAALDRVRENDRGAVGVDAAEGVNQQAQVMAAQIADRRGQLGWVDGGQQGPELRRFRWSR